MFGVSAAILLALCIGLDPLMGQSGTKLTGVVLNGEGAVIADASVTLRSKYGTLQTTTDWMGRFQFIDLQPGTYRIEVRHNAFATDIVQPIHIKLGEISPPSLEIKMEVAVMGKCGDRSTVSYEERSPDAAQLVGAMQPMPPKAEPNVSWPETPFSKATVELFKVGSDRVVASMHPDGHGKFRFSGLALGNYTLKVSYAGYYDEHSVKFQITEEDVTEVVIPMAPRGEVTICE
jgi:Carboxypeptidase regulatory-like domain